MSAMFAVCGIWGIQNSNNMTKEEAIRRIKAWNLDSDDMEVLSVVIPELAESEDEKIRKAIIATIEQCQDNFLNPKNRDRMLAYLERQKEQKPELCDMGRWDEESYNNGIHHVLQNPEAYGLTKQKPAEWSEEDEEMLGKLHRLLFICRGEKKFIKEAEYNKLDNWLEALRPRPHWKPSKEQMGALNYAYCELFKRQDVGHNILGPLQNLIDTLSKL